MQRDVSTFGRDYWVVARVILPVPQQVDDGNTVRAYYVAIGLTCADTEVRDAIANVITDGQIDWARTEWYAQDRTEIEDEDVISQIKFELKEGVWYRSGRILVP